MSINVKHTSYEDIYKQIEEADRTHTAKFNHKAEARRFYLAARYKSNNIGLGWIISLDGIQVTVAKSKASYMTVAALIRKLRDWDNEAVVEVAITDEDGITIWHEITDVEKLDKKSVKDHCLIYAGDVVMY